jgi:hypothetical protein
VSEEVCVIAKYVIRTIIGLCVLVFGVCHNAESSFRPEVFEYENGLMSVKGRRMPLFPLLVKISETTGIEIFVLGQVRERYVSANLVEKPLYDALRSILNGYNYAVLYSGKQPLNGVHVMTSSRMNKAPRHPFAAIDTTSQVQEENRLAKGGDGFEAVFQEKDEMPTHVASVGVPQSEVEIGHGETRQSDGEYNAVIHQTPPPSYQDGNKPHKEGQQSISTSKSQVPGEQSISSPAEPIPPTIKPYTRERWLLGMIERLGQRIESGMSDRDYEMWSQIRGERYLQHDSELVAYYKEELQKLNDN